MKRYLGWFALVALGAAFAFACLMVAVSRRHPDWIRRKLRIGALIVALSSTASCGGTIITCYMPAIPSRLTAPGYDSTTGTVTVNPSAGESVALRLLDRRDSVLRVAFILVDSAGDAVMSGDLQPVDGTIDESTEDFLLELPPGTPAGIYRIYYSFPTVGQTADVQATGSSIAIRVVA